MAIRFPWETALSSPSVTSPVSPAKDLDVHSGTLTVAAGVMTLLVPAAKKRAWLVVQHLGDSTNFAIVAPGLGAPDIANKAGFIELAPGDAVIFSRSDDMPWLGPVYAYGRLGSATVAFTEAQDFPIE